MVSLPHRLRHLSTASNRSVTSLASSNLADGCLVSICGDSNPDRLKHVTKAYDPATVMQMNNVTRNNEFRETTAYDHHIILDNKHVHNISLTDETLQVVLVLLVQQGLPGILYRAP